MRRVVVVVAGLLVLGAVPAHAELNVVKRKMCSDGARARLELTYLREDLTKVRFEVLRSPVGHEWRIRLVFLRSDFGGDAPGVVFFRGTVVASDGGNLVVQGRFQPPIGFLREGVRGQAGDGQTGEFCNVKIEPGW